jgi:hypothetical protein
MNTKTFKTGDIVTPEFLNELQNPSFNKQPGEVGALPLPPNYSEKQQCKTIHVAGETTSVNLGDWPYNAVIVVSVFMNGETPVYPRNLTVRCANTTGAIVVIPELDQNGTLAISVVGAGSTEHASASLKHGDIAVINAFDAVDEVLCFIRKLQTGDRVEYRNVLSSIFTVDGVDGHKAMFYIDSNFNLVISAANNSTVTSVDLRLPLKTPYLSTKKVNHALTIPDGLTTNDTRNTLGLYFERYAPDTLEVFRKPSHYSHQGQDVGMDVTFVLSDYNATKGDELTVHNIGSDDLTITWTDYSNNSCSTLVSPGHCKRFVALSATCWSAIG